MSALAALDRLIADLGTLPAFRNAKVGVNTTASTAASPASTSTSASTPFTGTVSRLLGIAFPSGPRGPLTDENVWLENPDIIQDVAWFPEVPPGHLPYTWGLDSRDVSYRPTTAAVTSTPAPAPAATSTPAPNAAAPTSTPAPAAAAGAKKAAPADKPAVAPKEQKEQKPKQEKPAKEKKETKQATPAPAATNPDLPPIARLDIRVGRIIRAWKHPGADSLYVEEIDVGEDKPRQVVSGLVKYIPEEKMQGARCLVICNLKPSKLRNETSFGMVLAASNADRTVIQLVEPPVEAVPGERVYFQGLELPTGATPDKEVNPQSKQNAWELVKGDLKTNGDNVAVWKSHQFMTKSGPCKSISLANANVS